MEYFENSDQKLKYFGDCCEGDSLAPTDNGNNIFGPFTSASFLNNTKVLNATNFFTFAPLPMQTYYWNIVKRNLEWYYGYVWGIHNAGILSTKTASKICKMSAQLTISGGIRIEGTPRAEKFMDLFFRKKSTVGKLKQKLPILNAVGFMLAKIDIDNGGNLDISFVQGNRYFAQTDGEKNVLSFYAVEKAITAPVRNKEEETEGYFLVEERYYKGGLPIRRYRIYKGPILATAPVFGEESISKSRGIEFPLLPEYVQRFLMQRFKTNVLNKEFVLPFDSIGAVIVLNTYCATGMDEYSCFADSTIADVHTQLYELDLTKTQKNESKYICQDFLVLPDTMIETGGGMMSALSDEQRAFALETANSGFNKRIVKKARYMDPAHAAPFVYQPELKTDLFNRDINQILNEIASGAQFSPVTLAGYLHNGVEKTATEVTADENATRLTIKDKRDLLAEPLNYLTGIVLKHYGIVDEYGRAQQCSIIFNDGSLSNPKVELENLEKKQQNGWVSQKTAIMLANPQFSRREAEEELKRIQSEQKQNIFGGAMYNDADYFGEGIDETGGQGPQQPGAGNRGGAE